MKNDYKVVDMPSMLSRDVKIQSPYDKDKWIRDNNWYEQIRSIYINFVEFLKKNCLVKNPSIEYSDDLVLFLSDLNESGQALVRSGADERWLDAFDRPGGGPPPSDTSILKRALEKIRRMKDAGD